MSSEFDLPSQKEQIKTSKQNKSFSNRNTAVHLPPYSHQFTRAKQRAFERYKKIYPVDNKQNIYPLTKTPNIGYYLMKGYRQQPGSMRDISQNNLTLQNKSSDKVITHLLKKYLERKENNQAKMLRALPRIDHSGSNYPNENKTATYLRPPRPNCARILTECDTRVERARPRLVKEV